MTKERRLTGQQIICTPTSTDMQSPAGNMDVYCQTQALGCYWQPQTHQAQWDQQSNEAGTATPSTRAWSVQLASPVPCFWTAENSSHNLQASIGGGHFAQEHWLHTPASHNKHTFIAYAPDQQGATNNAQPLEPTLTGPSTDTVHTPSWHRLLSGIF